MVTVCVAVDMRTKAMMRLPAVLDAGKATETDPTPTPWSEFACTSAIPPPGIELLLIVRLRARVAVIALASVTRTVKLLVPTTVGVPEITPVLEASASPEGNVPEAMDQI